MSPLLALTFVLLPAVSLRAQPSLPEPLERAQFQAREMIRHDDADDDGDLEGDAADPLPNFHTVSPGFYRSGQPAGEGFARIKALGIRTILTLRTGIGKEEKAQTDKLAIKVEHVAMNGIFSPSFHEVDQALAVLTDPSKRPILVHCHHGRDRTGTVIAAYRVVVDHKTPAAAAKEAEGYGCCPPTFKDLQGWLIDYARHRAQEYR